jgi:hypothetical protein
MLMLLPFFVVWTGTPPRWFGGGIPLERVQDYRRGAEDLDYSNHKGSTYPLIGESEMLHSDSISKPLVRTDVYVSAEQRDAMKALGAVQDISMAEMIRRVLDQYIRRHRQQQ